MQLMSQKVLFWNLCMIQDTDMIMRSVIALHNFRKIFVLYFCLFSAGVHNIFVCFKQLWNLESVQKTNDFTLHITWIFLKCFFLNIKYNLKKLYILYKIMMLLLRCHRVPFSQMHTFSFRYRRCKSTVINEYCDQ